MSGSPGTCAKAGGFPNPIKLTSKASCPWRSSPPTPSTPYRGPQHRLDLVLHFKTQQTGIDLGDAEACFTGKTLDRAAIEGCGSSGLAAAHLLRPALAPQA